MSKLILTFFCLSFLSIGTTESQDLYQPRAVKNAFKKGTRSPDGKPGKNYWQNHGRYDIAITAKPPERGIQGAEQIVYTNNSPDTLLNPVVKLIMNIHKPGAERYREASEDYLTSGVHMEKVIADGKEIKWNDPNYHSTWQSFHLPKPLLPHDSVTLGFNWHFDLSVESGREGMLDSSTQFLAYFYPRVAVYDDISGWDKMDFVEAQEFYNDFNDYTLTVNAPKNYVVWATGTLQNANEVLQPTFAQRLNQSFTSDEIIRVANKEELASGMVTAQNNSNAWKWTASNITDVAVTISNHYLWDASSVVVDNKTRRRASVQAAYSEKAKDFTYMVGFGKHGLEWLSNNWPGIPYPFEKTTIVQGFAGMEYPMMVNDETYPDTTFSRFVAEHEIAHTWFPFYMGINEQRYGFMDEGWATTFEWLIGVNDLGEARANGFFKQFRVAGWINDPAAEEDLPITTPGNILNGPGFGNNEYGKASLGYLAVKDLLGDDVFRKCLHGFMDRWHGKHPIPWDFFYSFNDISGKNLNWFWNSWFFSHGYIDLAIEDVKSMSNGYTVTIKNLGGFPAPTNIITTAEDGSTETFHVTPGVWEQNINQASVNIRPKGKIKSVKLDGAIFMDADNSNNVFDVK